METTFTKNGEVRVWNVYEQGWRVYPLDEVPDDVLASLSIAEREMIAAKRAGREIKINVFRHISERGGWCYAMWIDGRYDSSDALDISNDASESEALEAARTMHVAIEGVRTVTRVEDC